MAGSPAPGCPAGLQLPSNERDQRERTASADLTSSSSVGADGDRFFSRCDRAGSLPDILKNNAGRHGRNEDDDARRQRREVFQGWPRTQTSQAPTYSE